MKNQRHALSFALLSIFFWSTVASAFKLALRQLDVLPVLFFATLTSTFVIFIFLISNRQIALFFQQTKSDLARSALMGFLNPFIYYLILFKAYALLPAQEAQPLNWTWPIVLSIFAAIFLDTPLSRKAIIAIMVSFSGVIVISVKGDFSALSFSNPLGTGLALLSSIFWAAYWVLNLKDKRPALIKLTTNFVFGTIYITLAIALFARFAVPAGPVLALTIYIGLFEMGITFITWLKALSLAERSVVVANLGYLAPFLSLIFIHFIVGEAILPSSIIGLLLIIMGIILQTYQRPPTDSM